MSAYSLAGQFQGTRRLLAALVFVVTLALAGFAAAFLFAHGAADSQARFLPPTPSASQRP